MKFTFMHFCLLAIQINFLLFLMHYGVVMFLRRMAFILVLWNPGKGNNLYDVIERENFLENEWLYRNIAF